MGMGATTALNGGVPVMPAMDDDATPTAQQAGGSPTAAAAANADDADGAQAAGQVQANAADGADDADGADGAAEAGAQGAGAGDGGSVIDVAGQIAEAGGSAQAKVLEDLAAATAGITDAGKMTAAVLEHTALFTAHGVAIESGRELGNQGNQTSRKAIPG